MTRNDIQTLIEEEINPSLEMHGGYIAIHNFDEEKKLLEIQMGGGCQGCASSQATMMNGVEMYIRETFPDIIEINDVTDHLAGENPYYAQEQ